MEGGLDNLALFETTAVLHDINNFSDWVGAVCFLCAVLLLCVPCPTINIIGSCFLSCFHLLTPTSIHICTSFTLKLAFTHTSTFTGTIL